jgi:phage tail-like protein
MIWHGMLLGWAWKVDMFRYLNLENVWPGFKLDGLINNSGMLLLRTKSGEPEFVAPPLPGVPLNAAGLIGPAGIGMDAEGNVYIPDSARNQILVWRACDGVVARAHCFTGEGYLPGQLIEPRGVLVGPREALYVADSGNHRIQVIDLATSQLRSIWGQPDPHGEPVASSDIGRLNDPWDLAADSADFLYIVDHGNHRIQKFNADGKVVPAFWEALRGQSIVPSEPAFIATTLIDGEECLLVIDRMPSRVLVYRTDGFYDAIATERWLTLAEGLPGGLMFVDSGPCIDKAETKPALVFDGQGNFIKEIRNYSGPLAGLALDKQGRLLISPRGAATSLLPGQRYVETGYFAAGPFAAGDLPTRWQRVQATVDDLPPHTHIQFFTYTSVDNVPPSLPPAGSQAGASPTGTGVWRSVPIDAVDFLVLHEPAPFLWIGGILQGDGQTSPTLHQIRLEFEHDGWLRYLPAIYERDESRDSFLERALALFESLLADVEGNLNDLPMLFDPRAAPDYIPGSWLDWLSGWLVFKLEENWATTKRRLSLASAFEVLGRRGTVHGLRQFIAWYADIDVAIEEPARYASIWSLGDNSTLLGFTTMLAAAEAQGAVLGTTATVNGSHLIGEADYGVPLFEDLAHRFCVRVAAAELSAPGAMDTLRRIIELEKPAHTSYQICIVEPNMRVGMQARLGVDAIIGGPVPEMVLDAESELGLATALTAPKTLYSILGTDVRVGVDTRLI